jgi:hypothetical protein
VARATGHKPLSLAQALKVRNIYVAPSGLIYLSVSVTQGDALGYCIAPLRGLIKKLASLPVALPQAITLRPFGAFGDFQLASKVMALLDSSGSFFKRDGCWANEVGAQRVEKLMEAVKKLRP